MREKKERKRKLSLFIFFSQNTQLRNLIGRKLGGDIAQGKYSGTGGVKNVMCVCIGFGVVIV